MKRILFSSLLLGGCNFVARPPYDAVPASPPPAIARLASSKRVRVATEVGGASCRLQSSRDDDPATAVFEALDPKTLGEGALDVLAARVHTGEGGTVDALALQVRVGDGTRWIQNEPTQDAGALSLRLRCLIDDQAVASALGTALATELHLELGDKACSTIPTLAGGAADASYGTYSVGAPRPLLGKPPSREEAAAGAFGALSFAVPLTSGDKRLVVDLATARGCFSAGARDEKVASALASIASSREGTASIGAPLSAVLSDSGVLAARCHRDTVPVDTLTCAAAFPRFRAAPGGFHVERARPIDTVVGHGGTVVPSRDLVTEPFVVRLSPSFLGGTSKALDRALDAAADDDSARKRAARLGFRLLRPRDVAGVSVLARVLEIDATVTLSAPTTGNEQRATRAAAGTKKVENPAYRRAVIERAGAAAELAAARQRSVPVEWLGSLEARVKAADMALSAAPPTLDVPDERDVLLTTRTIHRRGEAKVRLRSVDKGASLERSFVVPFEATTFDEPADGGKGTPARVAEPPSPADLERAAATAIVAALESRLAELAAEASLGATGRHLVFSPGSRGWLVRTAFSAAGQRPVRALDVRVEPRVATLAQSPLVVPVTLPADASKRCFTFAASSVDGLTPLGLRVGPPPATGSKRTVSLATDLRDSPDVAVELCGLDPASPVALIVSTMHGAVPKSGVLIGVFASSPGEATSDDSIAAADGSLSSPPTATAPLDARGK